MGISNTFWLDFSIADKFGIPAIRDTYKRAFNKWKNDVRYLTELVITLNHKIWYYYDQKNMVLAQLYSELWETADGWCMDNLKGDDREYYLRETD